jgi:thiamine biosynthesis protein ThiS
LDIWINGEPKQVAPGTTIAALLQGLQMQPRFLAVERNQAVVPRAEHDRCVLQAGDRLEIVTLVGGG